MTDRPNVLVVCTDQQFAGAMGCAGNDDLETPAMDRLADAGTRFPNAYCAEPLCVPSRASMFTGRMPHEVNDDISQEKGFDSPYSEEGLGHLFDEAGYTCGYAGKWHVPEFAMPDGRHGFETLCGFDDTEIADACIDFLDRAHEDPFLLVASFDDPHNICEWSRNQNLPWGEIEDVPTEECPDLPRNFAIPPFEPAEIRPAMEDSRWSLGAMVDATPERWRHYRHAYYRLVERVDARIGRILDALDERGLAEETVVVFTSDHGDGNGAHQVRGKVWLYEEEVRVPLIVCAPGETEGGRVDDHLVSNGLDLVPTLCDYAGIDPPGDLRGRSLRDLAAGRPVEDWREYVVTQTFGALEGRMVRTDRHKYVVYDYGDEREQLFDLEADPGELVDRSNTAAYEEVLAEHREHLLEWCTETGDVFGDPWDYPIVPRIPGYDRLDIRDDFDGPTRFD
jgi:arylsulfatase A-like enzyme